MNVDQDLLRVINGSGFPLQIAVQHLVEQGGVGWRVQHKEHAWTNPTDGMSGFIDVVLQHTETKDSLVLECKRVQNAAWLFLSHTGTLKSRLHCKVWATIFEDENQHFFGWTDVSVPMETPEAQFCCLRGQSSNDKNTFLERVAGELVSATEALAKEERDYRNDHNDSCRLYFNVILTTAQLYFAVYDKSALNLEDGSLAKAEFHRVPYLRVRKQFSMRPVALAPADWHRKDDVDYRRENTVFVVEAIHLIDFLRNINVGDIGVKGIGA
jgi:hypothetical protein